MVNADTVQGRRRVIRFIEQRVERELHITWKKLSELAGVSDTLIRRMKNNPAKHGISMRTANALDTALQLEPGSIAALLNGTGEPVRKPGTPQGPGVQIDDNAPPSMMDIVRRWTRKLPPDDMAQLTEDLIVVRMASHQQGYDQGFEAGRTVVHPHAASPDPQSA